MDAKPKLISYKDASVCLSGGAEGSDLMWGMTAGHAGHIVHHWSFAGHKSKAPKEEIVVLTQEQLNLADVHLELAAKTLKRYWPPQKEYVRNLLRRNWFQVCESESLYAVSTLNKLDPLERMSIETQVKATVAGGTGWAVEMFLNKYNREACKCFVFDQEACSWFEWIGGMWSRIYEPPQPIGVWAGIGTRQLAVNGKLAIRVLMDYKPTPFSPDFHGDNYPWKKDHKYATSLWRNPEYKKEKDEEIALC